MYGAPRPLMRSKISRRGCLEFGVSNPVSEMLDAGVKIDKLLKPKHRPRNPRLNSALWMPIKAQLLAFS